MDAQELRLNNIIRHVSTGNNNVVSPNTLLDCWEYPHKYEPTPLSPEILDKCGFVVDDTKGFSRIDESNNIVYSTSGLDLLYKDGVFYVWYEVEDCWYNEKGIEIKYVHTLQNYFYALTQTELNIKL